MVSPRKKRVVVRQLRSGSKAINDSPEDWVSASNFQFKESPGPVKRDVQKSSRIQSSVMSKGRRQSHILKRLDASVPLTSPYSNRRRTRRQSMFVTSGSVESTKVNLSKRTSPVMKVQKPPKGSQPQKRNSPKQASTSETSFISPLKFYSSPKGKETKNVTRQQSSHQLPAKRKIDPDVVVHEVISPPKKLKESPTASKNAKKSSPKINESKVTKSPQAKRKLRSAIPKKVTSPKPKASSRANEKSPNDRTKLRSNDSKSTEISVVSSIQKKPNNSPIKGKELSKTRKSSSPKSPKGDRPSVVSRIQKKPTISPNKGKGLTMTKKSSSPKLGSPESKKKSPKSPKNQSPESSKKSKTPKSQIKPRSPKLRSSQSPVSTGKKLPMGKKATDSPRKTSSPQSKMKSPKKPSPKTPRNSSVIADKKAVKIKSPLSLTRLGSSPSVIKITRSSSRSARKVTVIGQSPKASGPSFRKTPLAKKGTNKDNDVDDGASPQLSAHIQLEMIRSRSPLRKGLGSQAATKVKPFTPKPDSPPSNVLKKTMKKKVAQKMHATTKVEVHQLLNGEISKPVSMVNGRKTMTASITVTQTKSNIAVTPRKPLSSDLLDGIVTARTPVSSSNLPPTPTSSRKLSDSVSSVRSYKSHTTTSASCQRSLLATIPRSSTPIEDDDDKLNPISVDAIVHKEDNFMDSSINTDQSEDNNSLTEITEQKEVSPEKPKRSYCSLM